MPAYVYKLPTFPNQLLLFQGPTAAVADADADAAASLILLPQTWTHTLIYICKCVYVTQVPHSHRPLAALVQQLLAKQRKKKKNEKWKIYTKQHPRGWLKNNKFDLEK